MNKPNTITTPRGDRMVAIAFEESERLIGITVTVHLMPTCPRLTSSVPPKRVDGRDDVRP
jgi:hypothetical protein